MQMKGGQGGLEYILVLVGFMLIVCLILIVLTTTSSYYSEDYKEVGFVIEGFEIQNEDIKIKISTSEYWYRIPIQESDKVFIGAKCTAKESYHSYKVWDLKCR